YHSSSSSYHRSGATADYMPYMYIADVSGCDFVPTFGEAPAPYGAPLADAIINSLSHEQFEMVSDPGGQGWYGSGGDSEIADRCETSFGPPASDGSTVRLANGHGYAIQREWSNATNSCTYG
ncbi:MAG TPA: hypothetical protein VFQ25_09880, partial [Ktedonobacterales bacterium]|nr:hypothetical protein [Ktedonobacterales bacterium]